MTETETNAGERRRPRTHLFKLALGPMLIMLSPVVGLIPGPGGLIVLAAGLGLTLRHSRAAKRLYVRIKRRWPRLGCWIDKGLRRPIRRLRGKQETPLK